VHVGRDGNEQLLVLLRGRQICRTSLRTGSFSMREARLRTANG
jgi:hypothetical protein